MSGWYEPRIKGANCENAKKFEKLRSEKRVVQNAKDKASKTRPAVMEHIALLNKKLHDCLEVHKWQLLCEEKAAAEDAIEDCGLGISLELTPDTFEHLVKPFNT